MMKEEVVLQMAAKTSVGRIRELNEDNFIVTNNIGGADWFLPAESYANGVMGTVMVVADGMGGTNAGEVASRIAVESVQKYFNALSSSPVREGKTGAILKDTILYAHRAIVNYAQAHPETEGMGTTLVVCWIIGGRAYVGWSGDSRCYAWHPSRGLRQLTKDHSYVQSLVDDGKITAAQAFDHPQSNIVLQSLGDGLVEPEPDVADMAIEKDEWLLVCSDGLSGMLTDAEIAGILQAGQGDVAMAVSLLVDRANEAGGADNITVVAAKVMESSLPAKPDEGGGEVDKKGRDGGKRRWKLFGILGLVVVAAALAAYSFVHSRKNVPVIVRGGEDSVRPAKMKREDTTVGTTGDPSADGHGGHEGPKPAKGGDSHPAGEKPAAGKKARDSVHHSHDAGEVARPGAPVPSSPKKDSVNIPQDHP